MADERTDFGFKRIECACTACVRNCYFLPGYLIPADLERIADHLDEADIVRFVMENLLASPGAIVIAEEVTGPGMKHTDHPETTSDSENQRPSRARHLQKRDTRYCR